MPEKPTSKLVKAEESTHDSNVIFGLDAEMKLKTLQSKKAKQRLKKKLEKEKQEEEANKEKLR